MHIRRVIDDGDGGPGAGRARGRTEPSRTRCRPRLAGPLMAAIGISAPRSRPLAECSTCVLKLLIGLVFAADEAAEALALVGGDPSPGGLREAAVLQKLIDSVHASTRASEHLDAILARELGVERRRYEGRSLCELAELWAAARHCLRGRQLAALLWTVARNNEAAFRKLESCLAKEIEVLAIRSLGQTRERPASPTVSALSRFPLVGDRHAMEVE